MPSVTFTKQDLVRETLDAAWYKLECKEMSDWKPGKSDPSANVVEAAFVITEGPKAGTKIKHWFSEKQLERIGDYIKCFTTPEPGKEYPLDATIGKPVMGYCTYDPKTRFNSIQDWKPVGK